MSLKVSNKQNSSYLNLSMGESIFTTPFAQETDPLPIEEDLWAKNVSFIPLVYIFKLRMTL